MVNFLRYPDLDTVQASLIYDPTTGAFHWRRDRGPVRSGAPAGRVNSSGYVVIQIDRREFAAHRLAWLVSNGAYPVDEIDHANGDRADNRIANLREATRSQNTANRRRYATKRSGLPKGVFLEQRPGRDARFVAEITKDRIKKKLGRFKTIEEAQTAYATAAGLLHGDFARVD